MATTEVLAILGAATGITGAVLGAMSFARDRARLFVRLNVLLPTDELVMYVVNAGRQPVAVVEVALRLDDMDAGLAPGMTVYVQREQNGAPNSGPRGPDSWVGEGVDLTRPWRALRRRWRTYAVWDALPESAEPIVLDPGELARFVWRPTTDDENKVAIQTIQGFVKDFRGRRAFSNEVSTGIRFSFGSATPASGASDST